MLLLSPPPFHQLSLRLKHCLHCSPSQTRPGLQISFLSLSAVYVSPDSIYKLHSLSLGYFCSGSSPSPRCTMPILCRAVCSAYFIHETIRDTCTSPQLRPRSRDSSLRFGIFFLFPTPPLPPTATPPPSILPHLSSAESISCPTMTTLYQSHPSLRRKQTRAQI